MQQKKQSKKMRGKQGERGKPPIQSSGEKPKREHEPLPTIKQGGLQQINDSRGRETATNSIGSPNNDDTGQIDSYKESPVVSSSLS